MMTEAYTQKRARWAARRGMLELDVILIPFIEKHYQQLTPAQQEQVTALLNADDPDLYTWLMGYGQPNESNLQDAIKLIHKKHGTIHN